MAIKKIRTNAEELAKTCREATGISPSAPKWITHEDSDKVFPDATIVAIVVDLSQATLSALKVFRKRDDGFEGMVLMTDRENLILIPWDPDWIYFCIGEPRVAQLHAA